MKKIILSIVALTSLLSCEPRDRISRETFEQVNGAMEVKRLSESEIIEAAMLWGDSITAEAQSQLIATLQRQLEEKGAVEALTYCHVNAVSVIDNVGNLGQVEIRRVSNRYRKVDNLPTDEEKELLDAYEYAAETGQRSDPNIQSIAGGEILLYTKPIVISAAFCLSCHGVPDQEVEQNTAQKLRELYPQDKALNHKIGDLRGMWSLRIPKKEVVKRL